MNYLDQIISAIAPGWGLRRAQSRMVMAHYEASTPGRARKKRRDGGSGNYLISQAGTTPRDTARYLDRNHDIVHGGLNTLVNNIAGANGIGVEPMPRNMNGELNEEFAKVLTLMYARWALVPEVTGQHDWPSCQRLLCRSWVRDGEGLAQTLEGSIPGLQHGTDNQFSIELLEADFLPIDFDNSALSIRQGIQRNAWKRPTNYFLYKEHPSDFTKFVSLQDLKSVPAHRIIHPKLIDRVGQLRGMTCLASVISRLEDLKDYEESERIAAKIAASMAAAIIKGTPESYGTVATNDASIDDTAKRSMKFRAGMIFDDLRAGESIQTIDTNRPNTNLESFRQGQLRAVAPGMGVGASSLTKVYDGNFSAQRQELIEQWVNYAVLQSEFINSTVRPVYRRAVELSIVSGAVRVPPGLDLATLTDAMYTPPQMPWIDPVKEVKAWENLEKAGYASGPEIIRKRGGNPRDVQDKEIKWRESWAEKGHEITGDPKDRSTENG